MAILTPIVESFVDTPAKVQTLLDLDLGWEGAQLEGVVYLQRYKQSDDDKNRAQLWELFHTCIHEYIHSLADTQFQRYAATKDTTQYNTLIEGGSVISLARTCGRRSPSPTRSARASRGRTTTRQSRFQR